MLKFTIIAAIKNEYYLHKIKIKIKIKIKSNY